MFISSQFLNKIVKLLQIRKISFIQVKMYVRRVRILYIVNLYYKTLSFIQC